MCVVYASVLLDVRYIARHRFAFGKTTTTANREHLISPRNIKWKQWHKILPAIEPTHTHTRAHGRKHFDYDLIRSMTLNTLHFLCNILCKGRQTHEKCSSTLSTMAEHSGEGEKETTARLGSFVSVAQSASTLPGHGNIYTRSIVQLHFISIVSIHFSFFLLRL